EVNLFFVEGLNIPSGKFHVPAMLWKANADHLMVFGLSGKTKPNMNTRLCHAPYLNIYGSGQVCMGTVQINIGKSTCLEEFTKTWEQYFFNSNFSHSISGNNSTKSNTTELWRSLAGKGDVFPQCELIKTSLTLKQIIQ
ncbi:MAG: system protein, partial [Mucilaginibacter sp.]|nr:system protein [Mucilaginibacter sp.]